MNDAAWNVINELRGSWCTAPCSYREACGCADAIQNALAAERDRCAKRAQYGDCTTGLGCDGGYSEGSIWADARKAAADDIRRLD